MNIKQSSKEFFSAAGIQMNLLKVMLTINFNNTIFRFCFIRKNIKTSSYSSE